MQIKRMQCVKGWQPFRKCNTELILHGQCSRIISQLLNAAARSNVAINTRLRDCGFHDDRCGYITSPASSAMADHAANSVRLTSMLLWIVNISYRAAIVPRCMTGVDAALECCGCSLLLRLHRLVDIYDALHGTSSLGDVAADLTLLTAASSPLCSLPDTRQHACFRTLWQQCFDLFYLLLLGT